MLGIYGRHCQFLLVWGWWSEKITFDLGDKGRYSLPDLQGTKNSVSGAESCVGREIGEKQCLKDYKRNCYQERRVRVRDH